MKKILLLLLTLPLFTFGQTILSVEQDVPLFLPEGWSMFGYSCFEHVNVIAAFETITDKVQLVKDYNGNVYMPEYGFNGIGDLESNQGYQIKTSQAITGFQFCPFIVPIVEGCIDLSAFNYNSLANTDDGSCIDVVEGCIDTLSFNYNQLANSEDNSCIAIVYGCIDSIADNFSEEANTDNESCIYLGCTDSISCTYIEIANTDNDSCDYPEEGFDCDGNWVTYYPIGDPVFLAWLQSNYPSVIVNDSLDIEAAATLESIYINNTGITDLDGLQYFTNLSSLYIQYNDALTSIPELSGLTNLSYLDIYNNDALECTIGYPEQLNVNSSWPPVCPSACPYDAFLEYSSDALNYDYDSCLTPVVNGCMDSIAENFNLEANTEDSSCEYIMGCMDVLADNYNIEATQDDASCIYYGCIDSTAYNFNSEANTEDGTCIYLGCMDEIADNYDSQANQDDESCIYYGCTDTIADNYDEDANTDNETCIYYGCIDESADNYDVEANEDDGTCIYLGCTNHTAENYNSQANQDDGSCVIYGCTFNLFPNYNSVATDEDGSCDMESSSLFGCTDPSYLEYDPIVNQDNGFCTTLILIGCMDVNACNFNLEANFNDDGACIYPEQYYDCEGNITDYVVGMEAEGGIVFHVDESGQHGLVVSLGDIGLFQWGCYNEGVDGADGISIGTGYQNSMDILNQGCETANGDMTSAEAADEYESDIYNDWYLPSIDELSLVFYNVGQGSELGNIANFSEGAFISSTESIYLSEPLNTGAEGMNFFSWGGGGIGWSSKEGYYYVCPIRSF